MPYKTTFIPGEIIRSGEFNLNFDLIDDYMDETTDARGSKSFLDDRLDVALNEDGTLKTIVVDHGSTTGLLDDDHTQYLLVNGTRNLTGNLGVDVGITIDDVDISSLKTDVDGFPDGLKNLTAIEIQQLANINLVTISNTQWGYLGELDQSLKQSSSPIFWDLFVNSNIDVTGDLNIDGTATFNVVTINDYTFPNYDGLINQVLTTDGSGNVSWQTPTPTGQNLDSGTFADRPISPNQGDVYVSISPQKRFFICFVAGTWSEVVVIP